MSSVREFSVLTDQVQEALIECDQGTIHRGTAIAVSLGKQLPPSVPDHVIALAVREALVRGEDMPDVVNPFLYARETALRMAGAELENKLESQEGNERRPPRGHVRGEGWTRIEAAIAGAHVSQDPEADAFMADMEQALERQPIYWLVRIPGNPPVREMAKDRLLDTVALLYRSRGQAAGQFMQHEGRTIALCLRKADAEWTRQRMYDWMGFVRRAVEAQRAGAPYVPEIPNAYRYLVNALERYRRDYGGEEADPSMTTSFAV